MNRRQFIQLTTLAGAGTALPLSSNLFADGAEPAAPHIRRFDLEEATIPQLQGLMASGKESAASLVKKYLRRIDEIDHRGPCLHAVLGLNPDAMAIARDLDYERKSKGPRGSMHGIPVLIKGNIGTHDKMDTNAGSLALAGSIPPQDSFVAERLRASGAVILGKANLSEWANYRGDRSSSGWSACGGQTKNPYVLDRNPSGSSSGSAAGVSANLCAVAVGTETDGSIISPSALCGVVGIKPTVGLVSRSGIVPISHSQDTAGPIARTVTDAAILLGALTGVDPLDAATDPSRGHARTDYARLLDGNGLQGAKLGVARRYFRSGTVSEKVLTAALDSLKRLGATLVDITEDIARVGNSEGTVMQYEFKADMNAYLASLGPYAPVHSLEDIIDFNNRHADRELKFFGQQEMIRAQARGPLTEQAYLDALERCRRLSRAEGIDAMMAKYEIDAIVAPSGGPAGTTDLVYGDRDAGGSSSPAAVAGYPNITVPAGQVLGLPVGLSFFGRAWSEPVLLKFAYAFEQGTHARTPPKFLPTVG